MDPHAFGLAVRWLHVAAMAVALGGAVLLTVAARGRAGGILDVAFAYERAFWLAAGLLVMTGVGNAASFGVDLPQPASAWGEAFVVKLLLVLLLVALSVPRTVAVVHLAALPDRGRSPVVSGLYGATALALLVVLAVALRLAHG